MKNIKGQLGVKNKYRLYIYNSLIFFALYFPALCLAWYSGRYSEGSYSGGGISFIWVSLFIVIGIGTVLFLLSQQQEKNGIPKGSFFAKVFRYGVYLSGISIALAYSDMPSEYYFYYMRIILSGTAVIGILSLHFERKNKGFIGWLLIGFAILFNPIVPVIIYPHPDAEIIWRIINLLYLGFLIFIFRNIEGNYYRAARKKLEIAKQNIKIEKQEYINEFHQYISQKNKQLNAVEQQVSERAKEIFYSHLKFIILIFAIALTYDYFNIGDKSSTFRELKATPIYLSIFYFFLVTFILSFITSRFHLSFTTIKEEYNNLSDEIKQLTSKVQSLEEELKEKNTKIIFGISVVSVIASLFALFVLYQDNIKDYLNKSNYEAKSNITTPEYNKPKPVKNNTTPPSEYKSSSVNKHEPVFNKYKTQKYTPIQQWNRSQPNLSITSNIDRSNVKIDGINMGSTPVDINLKPGIYSLEINKIGYSTSNQIFEITEKHKNGHMFIIYESLEKITKTHENRKTNFIPSKGKLNFSDCLKLSSNQEIIKCTEQKKDNSE